MDDKRFLTIAVVLLALVVSLMVLTEYLKTVNSIPTSYMETYREWKIYRLDGTDDPYYIAQSPLNGLCIVYSNLSDLKLDIDHYTPMLPAREK